MQADTRQAYAESIQCRDCHADSWKHNERCYGDLRNNKRYTANLLDCRIRLCWNRLIVICNKTSDRQKKCPPKRFKNWSVIKNGPVKMRYLTATASTTTSTSTAASTTASTISKITLTPTSALPAGTPTSTTTAPEHKNILLSYSYGEFPPSL